MKAACLCTLAIAALGAGASAQFDQFDWTLSNPDNMDVSVQADLMYFQTRHFSVPAGSLATFTTTSPVAGRVSAFADFWIEELVCGSNTALYVLGGQGVVFSNCSYYDVISFDVDDGETFGFGMKVYNPGWMADLLLTGFTFTPYWVPLGGALAGSAGTPSLAGHGILQAGHPFGVELAGAKPSAAVALVIGFTEVDLPFKGGILVPSPDRLIVGLASDANGELSLDATWPAGVPAGSEFILQAWITDSAGPKGFAASNAVQGFVL